MATIGIEWANQYHGRASDLKNNDDNARGFFNTLQGVKRFDFGDDLAWDQDFEQSGTGSPTAGSDQVFVDDVDIVFFSGHGSAAGGLFGRADRDDGRSRATDMRLGDQQCEWIIFDACQVLEDTNVFSRCGPVFTGLHYILGFHTICQDVGDRGRIFAERLNAGTRVRDAWIQACTETEGSDRQWAYMRADATGTDTFNDHWWGKGFTSPDPFSPTTRVYLRGSC
jgi:Family of unknown function (DUF6345)